ncbi:DgyrCDS9669 [Dimorphilus gyrociliatus]|nr:DgyrCDS9669 [Dimorphilus gyrociliatus]
MCTDATSCLGDGCNEGFIKHRTDGTCTSCGERGIAFCEYESFTSNNILPKICKQGFFLNTSPTPNTCEECDENCMECSTAGQHKCDVGKCKVGFFYNSDDQKCYKNKAGCEISIRSGTQTICQSCNTANSTLSNGNCKLCPTGCNGCSIDSTSNQLSCSSCKSGYYKSNNNLCVPCPIGCKTCLLDGVELKCTSCQTSFGLKGGLCESCDTSECESCLFDDNSMICEKCADKFYVNSNNCGKCPLYCSECSYNKRYECSKCYDGYAKTSDGQCIVCPSNCKKCIANSQRNSICTECNSNRYSLQSDGICRLCSDVTFGNCETCTSESSAKNAKCLTCGVGFALKDDESECISCPINGCGLCVHGRECLKCKSGFYPINHNRECGRKCYECEGNESECGKAINGNNTLSDKVKEVECGNGDCWAFRIESKDGILYSRKCSNRTCVEISENEKCDKIDGFNHCEKCCYGENCNTWHLDGKAGTGRILFSFACFGLSIIYYILF